MAGDAVLDEAITTELLEAIQAGRHTDVWRLSSDLSNVAISHPTELWPVVLKALQSADDESRMAIATNILEHMPQQDFAFFDIIEAEIRNGNDLLLNALKDCWKFGQANKPDNARRWDALIAQFGPNRKK